MYNQENINKSIELVDSMIKVMTQQAKEIEQLYNQIVKRSAEIDRICENIRNLENNQKLHGPLPNFKNHYCMKSFIIYFIR